jgi:hypothetical protein
MAETRNGEAHGNEEAETAEDKGALKSLKHTWKGLRSTIIAAAGAQVVAAEDVGAEEAVPVAKGSGDGRPEEPAVASWGSVLDKARQMVKDQITYDPVPGTASDGAAESRDRDLEAGDAQPEWAEWALKAAGRAKKKVAKAAKGTKKGITKAASKATSAESWGELGEQAKGLQTEVAKGLGKVTEAGSALSEKGKAAQQIAKDLQGKGTEQLKAAQQKAKDLQDKSTEHLKAAKAKGSEKAKAAAGKAKASLKQAKQNISGLAALSLSPAKIAQFGGVFFLGIFLISMSFSFLPIIMISPQKFALLFALGSMTLLSSFAILKGPKAFAASLVEREKLPFSAAYVVGLIGTLVATIVMRSYLLTAVFGVVQAVALLYFLASYVPGGQVILNGCGRCCRRTAHALCCRK